MMHWMKIHRLWIGTSLSEKIGWNWPKYFDDKKYNLIRSGPAQARNYTYMCFGIIEIRWYE